VSNFREKDHPRGKSGNGNNGSFIAKNKAKEVVDNIKMQRTDHYGNPVGDTPAEIKRANQIVGGTIVKVNNSVANVKVKTIATKVANNISANTKNTPKSQSDFWGVEYVGYKGIDAIEKLLKEKQGHIKNAFYVPQFPGNARDGNVDLVWGDSSGGLQHLIERRDKFYSMGKSSVRGEQMARKIPEIIAHGTFSQGHTNRFTIEHDGYRVVIDPQYANKKVSWIVTAMEIYE